MLSIRQLFLGISVIAAISWLHLLWFSVEYGGAITTAGGSNFLSHPTISNSNNCISSWSNSKSFNLNISSILHTLDPKEGWDYPEIDAVYTWVDGSKPEWQKLKEKYRLRFVAELENKTVEQVQEEDKVEGLDVSPNRVNRYADHGELKYSMRSILKHAPWVRKIYLVTVDGKGPDWLDPFHPKIHIVSHSDIFADRSKLPVFSSRAIEASLHNIPGISDYFLYFNDDFFLGLPIDQSEFLPDWPNSGSQRVFYDFWNFPDCNEGCKFKMLGNGQCDEVCKTPQCNWDFGDCGIRVREEGMKKLVEDRKHANYTRNSGFMKEASRFMEGIFNREVGISPTGASSPLAHIPYLINKRLWSNLSKHESFLVMKSNHVLLSGSDCWDLLGFRKERVLYSLLSSMLLAKSVLLSVHTPFEV